MKSDIEEEYFDWLRNKVTSNHRYDTLLDALYNTKFVAEYPMDENRISDGLDLKYRFMDEENYTKPEINRFHNICSVLEMMIALSIRMEEDIMSDTRYGNRTGQWFWNMIDNLGLGRMTNSRFNQKRFDNIMDDFMYHNYERDGHGSLFVVDCDEDLTKEEIWTQMNWFLNELEE